MRAHTCADTMARWKKVGEAAVEHADASMQAEIAELREALRPFAELADLLGAGVEDHEPVPVVIGHLRRARTLLNKDKSNAISTD